MVSPSQDSTIKVGVLHSLVGPWSIGEIALKDAELMAITEINQAGGVLGKLLEPVVEDGASEPVIFADKVRKLVQQDHVAAIFGCWTSTVRKYILPVLEELNTLLWYPVQHEGLECSKNIFYTGLCPNQQVEPAVNWLLENKGKRFYLVGSDIVFSHTCHKIIKAKLRRVGGTVLGEEYIPIGVQAFEETVQRIARSRPDVVFSTVNSDSNLGFYPQYRAAGISAEDIPILAVSVTEEEIQQIGAANAVGHYAAHHYFQSIDTPANRIFIENFKARYGRDRVTCDPVEAAYVQVYLWKQAVEQARSFDVDQVRAATHGQTLITPGGAVRIEQNQYLWKTCRIGKVQQNGQFEIVYSNDALHKPQPWLGVDDVQFPASELVIDMLAEAAQAIQYSCLLQQKSRELIEANQSLQALTHRVELLKRNLSSQIRRSLELDTILDTAVHEIRNLLEVDRCKFLWCEDSTAVQFKLSHEACNPELIHNLEHYPVQEIKELGQALLQWGVVRVDAASLEQFNYSVQKQLSEQGVTSLIAVLIRTHSDRQGVIVCDQICDRAWSNTEIELLKDVADQLAIAIDQAELYEQARTSAYQAQTQAQQLQQTLHELQTTQAQLIQTEKMSSLGQLIAGIAHEINNPVNFIYGNLNPTSEYTEDLLNLVQLYQHYYPNPVAEIQSKVQDIDLEFLAEDLPKLLRSMKMGADRIRQIVLSLRNFSRLDEAEMKLVDIHEGIDSTLLILHSRLKDTSAQKGIEVIKEYGNLPLVECYAGQLNQVFMNILSNAIDALSEYTLRSDSTQLASHSPQIRIQTEILNSNQAAIRIADNGPGIPQSIQERLFDPFFTTKPVGKGTGLGLAISYQIIVDKHGGALKCISHPGQGAEFIIHVPLTLGLL